MKRPVTMTVLAAAGLALAGLAWTVARRSYFVPVAGLRERLERSEGAVRSWETTLARADALDATIQEYADRTLGGDAETVDHALRSRLNRLAEAIGLAGTTVGTGTFSPKRSPARHAFSRQGAWRQLRDEIDFVELTGWISGEGTFEQVVQLVDGIDREPWLNRIDQLKLDPRENGGRFAVTARLTTLFLPGRTPRRPLAIRAGEPPDQRYAALLAANPFRLADAPPDPSPPDAAAATGMPLGQWMLTGVAETPTGPEIWLRDVTTGATKRLSIGGRLDRAVLVDLGDDWAEFEVDERRFRIQVGRSLDDGAPVDR